MKRARSSILLPALGLALVCAALVCRVAPAEAAGYLKRAEVRSFIDELHVQHGLDPLELERILGAARHQPKVVRLIGLPRPAAQPPSTRVRSYPAYRARFLTETRIRAGLGYWSSHEEVLQRAEQEFGVPAEVILGILGVETAFGRNTGSFRVLDALATIAFDGPRRREYFREELSHFLLLASEAGLDPLALKGSYAGAMGLPQFMPSSYRRFAVDYDGDGKIDLLTTPADAIGSIARYLQAHGWRSGESSAAVAAVPAALGPGLVSGLERSHTLSALRQLGLGLPDLSVTDETCALVELPAPGAAPAYWVTFANFEAITRYNRSTFYAAAVLELGNAIRAAREAEALAPRGDETLTAQAPRETLAGGDAAPAGAAP